jgi:hypothetical protein
MDLKPFAASSAVDVEGVVRFHHSLFFPPAPEPLSTEGLGRVLSYQGEISRPGRIPFPEDLRFTEAWPDHRVPLISVSVFLTRKEILSQFTRDLA